MGDLIHSKLIKHIQTNKLTVFYSDRKQMPKGVVKMAPSGLTFLEGTFINIACGIALFKDAILYFGHKKRKRKNR